MRGCGIDRRGGSAGADRALIVLAAWARRRSALAAALLGAISATALPPWHLLPMLLVAVPGLLWLIGSVDTAPHPMRSSFRIGFWFGFAHHLIGLYWITEAILVRASEFWWLVPFAAPLLAAVLALFIGAACAIAALARPGWHRVLALAGAWVLADLARQFVATGFPWNLWGADWAMPNLLGSVFIQPAAWVSVHGLTRATLLVAASPMFGRRGFALGAAALLLWAGLGAARLDLVNPAPAPGLNVALVQGNVAEGQKLNRAFAVRIFQRYLRLTARAAASAGPGPAVIVWPEDASPFALAQDPAARAAISAAAAGAPVLAGFVRFDRNGRPRNAIGAVMGPGPLGPTYDKWHLVPFGEYAPSWFPFALQVVPGGGFSPGPGPATLHVPGLPPVGPLICYESVFPGEVVAAGHRPAWLLTITNDAWFGNTAGPRQHLVAGRMRAVEEGLPLMRAANTGISAGFDAVGRPLGRLSLNRRGVLILPLPGPLPPTLFARLGLGIPGGLAALCLAAGLLLRRRDVSLLSGISV